MRPQDGPARRLGPSIGLALGFILVLSMGVDGAIVWTSEGALGTSVVSPPVHFEKGNWHQQHNRWIKELDLSEDKTWFDAKIKVRSGSRVHVSDVVRLTNPTGEGQAVELTGSEVADPNVEKFAWRVRDGASLVGRLDHKTPDPSLSFTLPAGATYEFDLRVSIAKGGHGGNTNFAFTMGVDPG